MMLPQVGVGGTAPTPRKESVASVSTARPRAPAPRGCGIWADAIGEHLLGVPFYPGLERDAIDEIAAALSAAFG